MEHWEVMSVSHNTPEGLWEAAEKYFYWCQENPIEIKRTLMSGNRAGNEIKTTRIRPYSLKALCLHCGVTEDYFQSVRETKAKDSLYYIVVSKILYNIWVQNYEMAMIDEFNPIMTAKVLGMDKEEIQHGSIKIEIVQGLPQLSESENEILEKLESEDILWKTLKDK